MSIKWSSVFRILRDNTWMSRTYFHRCRHCRMELSIRKLKKKCFHRILSKQTLTDGRGLFVVACMRIAYTQSTTSEQKMQKCKTSQNYFLCARISFWTKKVQKGIKSTFDNCIRFWKHIRCFRFSQKKFYRKWKLFLYSYRNHNLFNRHVRFLGCLY